MAKPIALLPTVREMCQATLTAAIRPLRSLRAKIAELVELHEDLIAHLVDFAIGIPFLLLIGYLFYEILWWGFENGLKM